MSGSRKPNFYGQGDPFMEAAFGACVRWARGNTEMVQAFERDTGMRVFTSQIEAAIDEATGYDLEVADAFVVWVIENLWGRDEARTSHYVRIGEEESGERDTGKHSTD